MSEWKEAQLRGWRRSRARLIRSADASGQAEVKKPFASDVGRRRRGLYIVELKGKNVFNPEEAEICKRRGHERSSEERWRQCAWCGTWFRQVCSVDERQVMTTDAQAEFDLEAERRKRLKVVISRHKFEEIAFWLAAGKTWEKRLR